MREPYRFRQTVCRGGFGYTGAPKGWSVVAQTTQGMRRTFAVLATFVATATPAVAADFSGPSGWPAVPVPTSSDAARTFKQWHLGDVATVTYIKDASLSYPDALGNIQKNFSANNIKPSIDKDQTCQGKSGHVVEFTTGPDGHRIVINRVLVPDGNGVATITYTRQEGSVIDNDVTKAEASFCGGS